jgi:hypothetical protein
MCLNAYMMQQKFDQNTRNIITHKKNIQMAAPVCAGAAALVRQYFMNGYYARGMRNASAGFAPSGALIKAMLINSAKPLRSQSLVCDASDVDLEPACWLISCHLSCAIAISTVTYNQ